MLLTNWYLKGFSFVRTLPCRPQSLLCLNLLSQNWHLIGFLLVWIIGLVLWDLWMAKWLLPEVTLEGFLTSTSHIKSFIFTFPCKWLLTSWSFPINDLSKVTFKIFLPCMHNLMFDMLLFPNKWLIHESDTWKVLTSMTHFMIHTMLFSAKWLLTKPARERFSPVWLVSWYIQCCFLLNYFSQNWHLKDLGPLSVISCLKYSCLWIYDLYTNWHLKSLPLPWVFSSSSCYYFWQNDISHLPPDVWKFDVTEELPSWQQLSSLPINSSTAD